MSRSSRFEEFLRASREELASFIASVTSQTQESLRPGSDSFPSAFLRTVDRLDLTACQEVLARTGPGGFSAVLHSFFCEELDRLKKSDEPIDTAPGAAHDGVRLTFSLKDESEVEEDIECARLVQHIESNAEASLMELRALCASLRGWHQVRPDAPPLHPQGCARVLLQSVRELQISSGARKLMLRIVAPVLTQVLKAMYAAQVTLIKSWGVKPARYQIQRSMDSSPTVWHASPWGYDDASSGHVLALLNALLATSDGQGPGVGGAGSPEWMGGGDADAVVPAETMRTLVRQLAQEQSAMPHLYDVIAQLEGPGVRLAEQSPDIWNDQQHPWWGLLDRVVQLCKVSDTTPTGLQSAMASVCSPIFANVDAHAGQGGFADQHLLHEALQALNVAVLNFAHRGEGGTAAAVAPTDAPVTSEPPTATETQQQDFGTRDEEDLDAFQALCRTIREQMARQLRSTTAPLAVRRFLQGPWVRVLGITMDPDVGGDHERAERYTELVDQILAPADPSQPLTLSIEEVQAIINTAREGLAYAKIPDTVSESHMAGLIAYLTQDDPDAQVEVDPGQDAGDHAALPTVPVELHGSTQSSRARRDRQAWLGSLRSGDRVRLFMDGQWMTLQLMHCDPAADSYQFKGRSTRPGYSLTRGALDRLRAEGLATTLELVG